MNAAPIPSIDLGSFTSGSDTARREIARQVDHVCRSIGFLVIENHGVPDSIVDAAWSEAASFFALPERDKLAARAEEPHCPRGYFPLAAETLAKTLDSNESSPDLKESFSCGPLSPPADGADIDDDFFFGQNIWPPGRDGFRAAWIAYYRAMESLGAMLMRLFATALELEPDYFAAMHTHHLSALRAINYPALRDRSLSGLPGAGAHADYGSVTILKPDPLVAGLQIRMPDGEWRPAPAVTSGFVVNIGDMLARWTNDRWVSTLHRVVPTDRRKQRQSLAYFLNPNHDACIRCIPTCLPPGGSPRYEPVMAGRYLVDKFTSSLAETTDR